MDLTRLETLKKKLVEADEFAPVWDYFMTHFGERPAFMKLGVTTRHPLLEAAVTKAAEEVFGKPPKFADLMLIRLPEHRFIHGGIQMEGRIANVFYFEDVGVGLLTIVFSFPNDTRLVRFTARSQSGGELARQ